VLTKSKPFSLLVISLLLIMALYASRAILHHIYKDTFIYLASVWLTVCIVLLLLARSNWLRLTALYAGTVFVTIGGYEAYLAGWFSQPPPQLVDAVISNPTYDQQHPILGYTLQKNCQTRATKYYDKKLLYDVTYTINVHGWRIVPYPSPDSATAVAFLGCSYTFGEGVNDNETLPYRFAEKSGGRFKAFNFGIHGYGPYQMLAIFENELEKPALGARRPRYAIYQALVHHVARCTGHAFWDQAGPKYILDEQGEAIYTGPFQNLYRREFIKALMRSHIMRLRFSLMPQITSADIDLYVGIVKKSANIFHQRYGGEFYVLLWPEKSQAYTEVSTKLHAQQIKVIKVEDILPDYNTEEEKYRPHIPIDYHPVPLTYEKIAEGLVKLF
jgi:hypothetical protein